MTGGAEDQMLCGEQARGRGRGRGRGGASTASERKSRPSKEEKPASGWASSLFAKWDGIAMMKEANTSFYTDRASTQARASAARDQAKFLRELLEQDAVEPEAYEKALELAKNMDALDKESLSIAEAETENSEAKVTMLEDFLAKSRAWNNDPNYIEVRLLFCQLRQRMENRLRELLDGKHGLSTFTDTPKSLAQELQIQNRLKLQQAALFESAVEELSKVTQTLVTKSARAIEVEDHVDVIRWQKNLVDEMQRLRAENARLEKQCSLLDQDKDRLRIEKANLQNDLQLEREEKENVLSELAALRDENLKMKAKQPLANSAQVVSSSADIEPYQQRIAQQDALLSEQKTTILKLRSDIVRKDTEHASKGVADKDDNELLLKYNEVLAEQVQVQQQVSSLTMQVANLTMSEQQSKSAVDIANTQLRAEKKQRRAAEKRRVEAEKTVRTLRKAADDKETLLTLEKNEVDRLGKDNATIVSQFDAEARALKKDLEVSQANTSKVLGAYGDMVQESLDYFERGLDATVSDMEGELPSDHDSPSLM